MLRTCHPRVKTEVAPQGGGRSCTVYLSQPNGDPGGWTIELYARLQAEDSPSVLVRVFQVSPRASNRAAARVVGVATFAGATSWAALVYPPTSDEGPPPVLDEGIQVGLFADDVTVFGAIDVLP
jgi:hypothetical protein